MIRLVLYFLAFVAVVYFLVWLKSRWDRLRPELKKKILYLGLVNLIGFLKLKWQIILGFVWQILKRFIGR